MRPFYRACRSCTAGWIFNDNTSDWVKHVVQTELEYARGMRLTVIESRRWVSAVAAVQQSLPASVQLKTWQLDAYSDEPYCQNFRGDPSALRSCCKLSALNLLTPTEIVHSRLLSERICIRCHARMDNQ